MSEKQFSILVFSILLLFYKIVDVKEFTDSQLSRQKKRAHIDTEDDAWAGYKPKFIKTPVNRVWKFNRQPLAPTIPEKKPKKTDSVLKEGESKPIVASQSLVRGQSAW